MAEERKNVKHTVVLDRRENISITGVMDVISFDEETIEAETEMGILVLKGSNLHVNKLNLDNGELEIDGMIESLVYEDEGGLTKSKGSFLSKIFK